jgi:hypothetical protein
MSKSTEWRAGRFTMNIPVAPKWKWTWCRLAHARHHKTYVDSTVEVEFCHKCGMMWPRPVMQ